MEGIKKEIEKQNNIKPIPFKDYSVKTILDVKEEDKKEFKDYIRSLRKENKLSVEEFMMILYPIDPETGEEIKYFK